MEKDNYLSWLNAFSANMLQNCVPIQANESTIVCALG